jgi:hypothetical protein
VFHRRAGQAETLAVLCVIPQMTGARTQGLTLARQVLYHLTHFANPSVSFPLVLTIFCCNKKYNRARHGMAIPVIPSTREVELGGSRSEVPRPVGEKVRSPICKTC